MASDSNGGECFIRLDSFNPIHTSGSSIVQRLGHPFHRGILLLQEQNLPNNRRGSGPRTGKTIRFLRSYSCPYCNRVRCNIAMEGQQEEPVRAYPTRPMDPDRILHVMVRWSIHHQRNTCDGSSRGHRNLNAVERSKSAIILQGLEELGNRHPPDSIQVPLASN